jgi:hypothetical protein
MSPGQVGKKLLTLEQRMKRERENALRRTVRRGRQAAQKKLSSRGIGRALWGKGRKKSSRTLKGVGHPVLKTIRVKTTGGSMRSGIQARGIAAMIEEGGGRTAAHIIKPVLAKALQLKETGVIIRDQVKHPGSRIPHEPFLNAALVLAKAELPPELEKAHRQAIAAEGLG